MGFKKNFRNKGAFESSTIQEIYNQICKSIEYDAETNFVYPSKLVDGALYGWTENKSFKIWPRGPHSKHKKEAEDVIGLLMAKNMINTTPIESIALEYKATTKDTHVAEIKIKFEDSIPELN